MIQGLQRIQKEFLLKFGHGENLLPSDFRQTNGERSQMFFREYADRVISRSFL